MLTTNKWPEIPALAPDADNFPAAAAADQIRMKWEDSNPQPSEWGWLEPLFPELVSRSESEPVDDVMVEAVKDREDESAEIAMEAVTEPMVVAAGRAPRRPRGKRAAVMAGAFGVGLVAVTGLAVALMGSGSSGEENTAVAEPVSSVPAPQTPVDPCPEVVDGPTTSGDGVGDQKSGAGAILAWNHAYYVARSASEAKAVTADGAVATEGDLQAAIDAVPRGTTHCVQITDRGQGLYAVRLTVSNESSPIRQIVRTEQVGGGRWVIESFRKDGS